MTDDGQESETNKIMAELDMQPKAIAYLKDEIAALVAENCAMSDRIEKLSIALKECAASWDSGLCTVSVAYMRLQVEFQRRLNIAANAL